jgi:transcription factor SPN1
LDDIAESFVRRMARAADNDCDAIEAGRPALEKQKMLAEVLETLMKRHLHEALLDNDLLGAVRRWLEPMPNRTLPAPNIRKALLEQLRGLPIETVHLRESGGLGRIVNFFSQRPGELDDLRRLSSELVSLWARPILQRASNKNADDDHAPGHSSGGGKVLRSEALRTGTARRYSGGSVETRQQRRIAQSLTKKKARPSTKF